MNRFLFLYLLLLCCTETFAKKHVNIDSLNNIFAQTENVQLKFDIQCQLYLYYIDVDDQKSIQAAKEALVLAELIGEEKKIRMALLQLLSVYSYSMQSGLSLNYLDRLKQEHFPYLEDEEKRKLKYREAFIHYQMGFEVEAQTMLYELLEECKAVNDSYYEIKFFFLLGHIYLHQGEFNKALQYFSKNNEGYRKAGNENDNPSAYFSMATTYTQMGEYEKAKEYARIAYAAAVKLDSKTLRIKSLDKLAEAFFYENDLEKTEEILDQALLINDSLQNQCFSIEFFFNKGFIEERRGNNFEALKIYEEVIQKGEKYGFYVFREPVYERLKNCYEELGQYKKALYYLDKLTKIKDSIHSEKSAQQLRFNQIKFETTEKEHENQILSAQVSRQKNQNYALIALIFASIAFLIAFISTLKIRQVKKIERIRMEIAQDLHDELGSKLTHIQIYTNKLAGNHQDNNSEEIKKNIQGVGVVIRDAHFAISDLVWAINPEQGTMKDLINQLQDYTDDLLRPTGMEYSFDYGTFKLDKELNPDLRQNIMLFFKEAINNIIRHTYSTETNIKLHNFQGKFQLEIENKFDQLKTVTVHGGKGIHNMQQRAKKMDGEVFINKADHYFSIILTIEAFA